MLPQIFDDIIELEKQKKIESAVLSPDFNWFFANTATYKADENMSEKDKSLMNFKNTEDKFQFIHYLYRDKTVLSQKILIFDEILEKIFKIIGVEYNIDNLTSKLYRMKVNFTTPVNKKMSFVAPHIDVKGIDTETFIYYINDADGDTKLFHQFYDDKDVFDKLTVQKTISPKRGRLIRFDGNQIHSASRPVKSDYRLVLNVNILK